MFRHATPDLYRASRFALYAERMMPLMRQMVDIQNGPIDPLNAMAKIRAKEAIAIFRPILFPEDESG